MTRNRLGDARGPAVVAAAVLGLLVAGALQGRSPGAADVLPPAPPLALPEADADAAARLAGQGITLSGGWQPYGVLGVDDPWALLDPGTGVRAWIDRLPRIRLGYDDAGRLFVEDAAVIADPGPCYLLARIVRRVGVGLPPPAGPNVAAQLEAWLEPPYFSGVASAGARGPGGRGPGVRGPCSGGAGDHFGFAIEQAEPLPCSVPDRDVVCFTLAKWRYDFGARDAWTSTHRAFDVSTGDRLDDVELHPGLDIAAFDVLVDDAVCASGGRCDGVAPREGRIHPTRDGLIVEFSPGEAADAAYGSLRLIVPRSALPLVMVTGAEVTP